MAGRTPIERHVQVAGFDCAYWEWPGEGTPVLIVHGIGLHGRTWDRVIEELPPSTHVIAPDLRGHGRSEVPPVRNEHLWWGGLGHDLAALLRAIALPPALGVGHSMGGHAMIFAAADAPEHFASLLLFEPNIGDPERARIPEPLEADAGVARRRNDWASPDEMFERFAGRPPFNAWDPAVLRAYCDYGLVPEGDRFRLACPPALEATIWGGQSPGLYDAIDAIDVPVHLVRAEPRAPGQPEGFTPSQTWPGVVDYFHHGTEELLSGRGHFFALETAPLAAALIETALARLSR
ncbi:MAG: alpha/beta hydrolase [Chloroflexi bacterium]|nr:alpha/beta hydrolase [Chloroflexota bacterium]MDA1241257.1 alpha/beta hydrolase [Chloroflexota bacterium]